MKTGLILLDRDGVLNRMVVDAEHGTIDSPLHPSQVALLENVPEALARLTESGYGLVIVSNQPAAAKGKTTVANLEAVHQRVLALAQGTGGRILSSHLCLHRREDGCDCRKPATGLLEKAFQAHPGYNREASWMVGDGLTDMEAGQRFHLKTAFIGPRKTEAAHWLHERGIKPTLWVESLAEFADQLTRPPNGESSK